MLVDQLLDAAIAAARLGPARCQDGLEALAAPIYMTDEDGLVVAHNRACITFAGRVPVNRQDRWCVTWKLHTLRGDPLPHDQCPMAFAVRQARTVRGMEAVAERPDGSRVHFRPYPTPLFDGDARFLGAVNLLLDVTRSRAHYQDQARRCRRLAAATLNPADVDALLRAAEEYEALTLQVPAE